MRILIAEDDYTSRTMLSAVLQKAGHDVLSVEDGYEAWQILQQEDSPKLLILDLLMPKMDGLEVIEKVRASQNKVPPYIIMLTSRGEKRDIIQGLDAGADDYLTKPFDVGELRARIEVGRRLLEMQKALIESRELLAHQATHDPMTDLLNRRAIISNLQSALLTARKKKTVVAVGMIDIDHFKRINDTYGHQVGDDVLIGLAKQLKETTLVSEHVSRFGGEEFLVFFPMNTKDEVESVFASLFSRISGISLKTRQGLISITVSIGIAVSSPECSLDELIGFADEALYAAKEAGRNRMVFASSQEC
ncbi:MAG: diguanylate cyclase [Spirochaetia bacterium]|nr:diguanylate cyclase [Spirochaetia bacterium]